MKATQRITSALLVLVALNVAQAFAPPSQQSLSRLHRNAPSLAARPSVSSPPNQPVRVNSIHTSHNANRARQATSLPAAATVAAITGAITGGVFAGGLHAIAGEFRVS